MVPFFGDQFRNAARAQHSGYAKSLNFHELSTELLVRAIQEMTANQSYSKKAKEMSAVFRDNLVHPLDEAVWWVEHVAKFRGAKHLKSHAVYMSMFSYLLLDVFGVLILSSLSIIFAIYFGIKFILSKKQKEQKKKEH